MQKQKIQHPEITLIGLAVRTNNQNEMQPEKAKIATLAGKYWERQVANDIKSRSKPGVTYAIYTDYASDEHGDYTYFIGEVVDSLQGQDLEKFTTVTIPAGNYSMFTTAAGKMPEIVITAWQEIWTMQDDDLGGKRQYLADFEVYDARAMDPDNTVVDIYIGI